MGEVSAAGRDGTERAKLPRRDWFLLPLIGLGTILLLLGGGELTARRIFYLAGAGTKACTIFNDPVTGTRGVPNSVCWEKALESQLTEYRFNRCGHRTSMDCGLPPDGAFRIVTIGSSFAAGSQVAEQESFAALLPRELTRLTGRRVELYNAAIYRSGFPSSVAAQMKDVVAQQPNLILLVVTPWDVENAGLTGVDAGRRGEAPPITEGLKALVRTGSTKDIEQFFSFHLRLIMALRHTLYLSQSQYMRSYLADASVSSVLAADWSPQWKQHMADYEVQLARIAKQARAAGIPLAVVQVPNRAEATMISMGNWPAGYNPYKLGDEVRAAADRNCAIYIDILPEFRDVPNAERYYMPVDTHPYPSGHALLAGMIARGLSTAAIFDPGNTALPQSRARRQ